MHTSPLDQPGTGDAGGMNVYVLRARPAAGRAAASRSRSSPGPPPSACRRWCEVAPGVLVRHVVAGPVRGADQGATCPASCAPSPRACCAPRPAHEPGYYDLVHSHYWLSGQVGWLAARPVGGAAGAHRAHPGQGQERRAGRRRHPRAAAARGRRAAGRRRRRPADRQHRHRGAATGFAATTPTRRASTSSHPGVDLDVFTPGDRRARPRRARACPPTSIVLLFVGRIQPLKAPDVLLRAVARAARRDPALRDRLRGRRRAAARPAAGWPHPDALVELAAELGIADRRAFLPPRRRRPTSSTCTAPPTWSPCRRYSESFGLVAVEAQACGTPVVAAAVGGLPVAVRRRRQRRCWSTATTRATGRDAIAPVARRPARRRDALRARRARARAATFALGSTPPSATATSGYRRRAARDARRTARGRSGGAGMTRRRSRAATVACERDLVEHRASRGSEARRRRLRRRRCPASAS